MGGGRKYRERHIGRSLRVDMMDKHPFCRVILDVLPCFVIILLIADDMIVIGFLPELFVEGSQKSCLDTADVVVCCHGFEKLHHIR